MIFPSEMLKNAHECKKHLFRGKNLSFFFLLQQLYPDSETEHHVVGILQCAETITHKKEKPL